MFKKSHLTTKPVLSHADHVDDRELEIAFNKLQELEDHNKKLYKEVKRYEDVLTSMHRLEAKMAADLAEFEDLKPVSSSYQDVVVYQMGHAVKDLKELSRKTVVDPLKKLHGEFGAINAALRRRDQALIEVQRAKTPEKAKKAQEDFDKLNRMLLLELPQFYDKRVDYFSPCLQALVRAQVDFYGESTRLFTQWVGSNAEFVSGRGPLVIDDEQHDEELDKLLADIRSLSIVGN